MPHGPLDLRRSVAPYAEGLNLRRPVVPAGGQAHPFRSARFEPKGDGLQVRGLVTARPGERQAHPFERGSPAKAKLSPKGPKGRAKVKAAFKEVHEDEPDVVATTRRKKGKGVAERQRTAIALSKARLAGVRIPKR